MVALVLTDTVQTALAERVLELMELVQKALAQMVLVQKVDMKWQCKDCCIYTSVSFMSHRHVED